MKRRAQWINRCGGGGFVISALTIFLLLGSAQAEDIVQRNAHVIDQSKLVDKSKFWDFSLRHIEINGKMFHTGQTREVHVKVGEKVTVRCHYGIATIPISQITEQDVEKWGSGNISYHIAMGLDFVENKWVYPKYLPKFTYQDVQFWGGTGQHNLYWPKKTGFIWTPKMEDIGKYFMALCTLDNQNEIKEFNEDNNSTLKVGPYVRVIVTQPIEKKTGITPKKDPKIEKKLVPKTTN